MKTVNTLLGLAEDASEEALHSEVSKLLETTNPLTRRLAELESAHSNLLLAQVDSDLLMHKNRILDSERPKWKEALLKNRKDTLELLSTLPQLEAGPGEEGRAIDSEVGQPACASPAQPPGRRRVPHHVRHHVGHSLRGDDGSRQAVGSPSDQSDPPTSLEIEDTVQNRALARKARADAAEIKWQEPQNTPENRALAKKIANRAEQLRRNVKSLTYEDSWVMAGKELGQTIY